MPGIVRKLFIYATVDGLVLQPLAQRGQRPGTAVTIDYKTSTVRPLLHSPDHEPDKADQLESYGIIGLLKVSSYAYLITISRRQQVAQIFGKPVYLITGISVIPLGSQPEAQQAIKHAQKVAKKSKDKVDKEEEELVADSDSETASTIGEGHEDDHSVVSDKEVPEARGRPSIDLGEFGVVQNVIEKKGAYGRFADRWFSKKGWTTGSRRNQGMTSGDNQDNLELPERSASGAGLDVKVEEAEPAGQADVPQGWPQTSEVEEKPEEVMSSSEQDRLTTSLIPKLVQTTKLLLASRTFFYSFDQDITNRNTGQRRPNPEVALHKQANPNYFWNGHLTQPFLDAGFNEYVVPIMQGFVGQREFNVKAAATTLSGSTETAKGSSEPVEDDKTIQKEPAELKDETFLITLISRRSVKRNGLRYLRRGVDEDGNVANSVETEQILSTPDWDMEKGVQSFVQCRGSIPLFFSQIPYSFKPVPALHGTPESNQQAMKKHYTSLENRYGQVHTVSLIDRHGTEPKVGQAFEDNVKAINESGGINGHTIGFNWWEFHHICRGMKFEKVSLLVDETSEFLSSSQWTATSGTSASKTQSGIIRTNCMDCLDRTNVVQSAFGQSILEQQLSALGYPIDLRTDLTTSWFNTLWADNGDAISRAYTGTSALKGDYTRTRKRNVIGALTDFSLTLSRYYQNLFEDFFAQAAIDYLLGGVDESVFSEFEATMTTADPAIDLRKARQSAIAMAANVVIENKEDMMAGWALASPQHPSTLRTWPFEETLVLLTERAVYIVRCDWTTEKVHSFERIALERLVGVQWGAYITETHTKSQLDPKKNVGFVLRFRSSPDDEGVKVFTRSLETAETAAAAAAVEESQVQEASQAAKAEEESRAQFETSTSSELESKLSPTKPDDKTDTPNENAKKNPAKQTAKGEEIQFYAFKSLPSRSSAVKLKEGEAMPIGERDVIHQICVDIERAVNALAASTDESTSAGMEESKQQVGSEEGVGHAGRDGKKEEGADTETVGGKFEVVEGDVISPQEARRSTGYLETIGYSLKKLVWG